MFNIFCNKLINKTGKNQESKNENPYESNTSSKPRTAPSSSIKLNTQHQAVNNINSLKEKANLYFQSQDFQKANEVYTECIKLIQDQQITTDEEKQLFSNIYLNRAITNIKLQGFSQAEADCTSSIGIDQSNVKSYLKRGISRMKLKKYKEAHDDFKVVLSKQPDNKEAQKESNLIEDALKSKKEQGQSEGDCYDKLEIQGASGSESESDDDDDEEEEDVPIPSKFARLSTIDKKATHSDSQDTGNVPIEDRKRSVLFIDKPVNLDLAQQSSYHKDEVPEYSILKNPNDLAHLVKNIDTKLIKHSVDEDDVKEDGSHTVKFKGAEIPTQTFTPRHNLKPRNSILKNSPLVADQFHAQIKDIDGKIVHHSRFKDENQGNDGDDNSVHFKRDEVEKSPEQHHQFKDHPSSPKKHILKHHEDKDVDQLHEKYFQEKSPEKKDDDSFTFNQLKNIDGKSSEQHKRSPRHKPQFEKVDDTIEDEDDKKVHFGQIQNVNNNASQVPAKESKPRSSILKSQGNVNSSAEIQKALKIQEEQQAEEGKVDEESDQDKKDN